MLQTALRFSHQLLKEVVSEGDIVIDGTMGNGHDTLLLAQLVGDSGHVYAFDIQKQALETTQQRLEESSLAQRVSLSAQGHQKIAETLPAATLIKAAIFNLGYLPQSDKQVITLPTTTQTALHACVERLVRKGRIIIVAYYGHPGGPEELATVTDFCQQLPQKDFNVLQYQFINQKNQPPILFCIEKK